MAQEGTKGSIGGWRSFGRGGSGGEERVYRELRGWGGGFGGRRARAAAGRGRKPEAGLGPPTALRVNLGGERKYFLKLLPHRSLGYPRAGGNEIARHTRAPDAAEGNQDAPGRVPAGAGAAERRALSACARRGGPHRRR